MKFFRQKKIKRTAKGLQIGRPKTKARPRPFQIQVRVSEKEKKIIQEKAGTATPASYMRALALQGTALEAVSLSKEDKQALLDLTKQVWGVGNNLNQIARVFNEESLSIRESNGGGIKSPDDLAEMAQEIKASQDVLLDLLSNFLGRFDQ